MKTICCEGVSGSLICGRVGDGVVVPTAVCGRRIERVDDGERMLPNSTDRERGRAGENMSSVESCRGGL